MGDTRSDWKSGASVTASKAQLRARLLLQRRAMSVTDLAAAAHQLTATVLAIPRVQGARCVAGYVSVATEPATRNLLDELVARDVLVLTPVLLSDGDLDWSEYSGSEDLEPASHGLLEPMGPRLGVDAIVHADVVLVPALAVDQRGHRLGRGGGSYDRALRRVRGNADGGTGKGAALTCALLYDGELLPPGSDLPVEPHDVAVHAAATPTAYVALG